MSSKTKIIVFIILNCLLLTILYLIPIDSKVLNNICLFKLTTGKECWNCGMTRAFLSIIHFNFKDAYNFNKNVVIIFPLTIGIYLYSWYQYIFERRCKNGRRKQQ